jgi:hypothetical protein
MMIRNLFLLAALLICFGLGTDIGWASDIDSFQNYLGVSLPYSKENPQIELDKKYSRKRIGRAEIQVILTIDEKGKVQDISFTAGSAAWIIPIQKSLKKIRFRFSEGSKLGERINVPIEVIFGDEFKANGLINLKLPIVLQENETDSEYKFDRELAIEFLRLNNVVVPGVIYIPPMKFRVYPPKKSGQYITVVARVQIDETGELIDATFPIAGMNKFTHSVLTALINSKFSPASINDSAIASDFLLVFRFFDNILYPYSPTESADSSGNLTHAQKWFMKLRLNPEDIYIHPIPRNFPLGYFGSSGLTRNVFGGATGKIHINPDGKTSFSASSVHESLKENISKIMSRFTWYPAVNSNGDNEWYSGKVKIKIDFEKKVVCNAEWLE